MFAEALSRQLSVRARNTQRRIQSERECWVLLLGVHSSSYSQAERREIMWRGASLRHSTLNLNTHKQIALACLPTHTPAELECKYWRVEEQTRRRLIDCTRSSSVVNKHLSQLLYSIGASEVSSTAPHLFARHWQKAHTAHTHTISGACRAKCKWLSR